MTKETQQQYVPDIENIENKQISENNETEKKGVKPSPVPLSLMKKVKNQIKDNNICDKSLTDIKIVCQTFVDLIIHETKIGNTISLPNHMTFKRIVRKQRKHHNPKTREEIMKPPHYVMSMDVKPALKQKYSNIPIKENKNEEHNVNTKK